MDWSIEWFVARSNVARYEEKLKTESDPRGRKTLLTLLAEERARLASQARRYRLVRSAPAASPVCDLRPVAGAAAQAAPVPVAA